MTRRILLTGGGTGGSVTPLLAVARQIAIEQAAVEFLFVGTRHGPERSLVESAGLRFQAIPAGKWRRYWSWQNLTDLKHVAAGFSAARKIVASWRPDTVVSAGSFVSVPVVWAARLAGCKILIHQQDVRPGLANRLMAPAADVITVVFERSIRHFPAGKVHHVGNPIRPEILGASAERGRALFHLDRHIPVVLVVGGGTGSAFLNHLVSTSAVQLIQRWQVLHITGPEREYVQLTDNRYRRFDFLTWEMPHALAVADVVVSRAGLGLISELAALSKPAMLVPMPDTHQVDNARALAEAKAAIFLPQEELGPEQFIAALSALQADVGRRRLLSQHIHRFYRPDALIRLTDFILHLTDT